MDGLKFCTLFILLKPSKGLILLLNHSESLLGELRPHFNPIDCGKKMRNQDLTLNGDLLWLLYATRIQPFIAAALNQFHYNELHCLSTDEATRWKGLVGSRSVTHGVGAN